MVIVVMGIVFSGLAVVIQQAIRDTYRPEFIMKATSLANKEAERLMQLSFANVVDENRDAPVAYTGNFTNFSWEVRVDSIDTAQPNLGTDPTMTDYKVVEVRIHNSALGDFSLKFLRTNY